MSNPTRDSRLVRFDKSMRSYWYRYIAELGTVMVGAAKLSQNRYGWAATGLGLALAAFGHWSEWQRSPNAVKLQEDLDRVEDTLEQVNEDIQQLLPAELRRLMEGMPGIGETERLSMFKHSRGADSFSLVGRYSRNPEFCKDGRGHYPLGNDIISSAWRNGEASSDTLPDPEVHWGAYKRILKRQGIDDVAAEFLTMKSRCLYARAIGDGERTGTRVAVVVFESILPQGLHVDLCRSSLNLQEEDRLCGLLGCMRELECQSGTMASRRGL